MARNKRADKRRKAKRIALEAPARETPAGIVSWPIREDTRVRCPLCSMLPSGEWIRRGPYEVEILQQLFGGSFPSPTGRMRQRQGYMEYREVDAETLVKWKDIILDKLKAAQKLVKSSK